MWPQNWSRLEPRAVTDTAGCRPMPLPTRLELQVGLIAHPAARFATCDMKGRLGANPAPKSAKLRSVYLSGIKCAYVCNVNSGDECPN
jgi:hypothetical protein